jgi:hypothetical protein
MKPSKLANKVNTMTVTEFARLGGLTKSPARAKASRANGKLGGRPKKVLKDVHQINAK